MASHNLTEKTGVIGGGGGTTGGGSKTTVESVSSVALGVTNTRYVFRLTGTGNTINFPPDNSAFEITIIDAGGNFGLATTGGLLINGVSGQTIATGAPGEAFSCNYNYFLGTFSRAQGSSKINFDPQMTSAVPPASATDSGSVSRETSGTHSTNWSGPFASTVGNILYSKVGKTVTLILPDVRPSGNSTSAIAVMSTVLPADLRPASDFFAMMLVVDNNVSPTVPGSVQILANGNINVFKDLTFSNFTSTAGTVGFRSSPITYRTL